VWLALELTTTRQPIIAPDLPKFYKEAYREILKADPCAVDLHKFGLYFYELGSYAKQFDPRGDVAEILLHVMNLHLCNASNLTERILQTFTLRFRQIMDLVDNVLSDPTITQRLDALECSMFKTAHDAKLKLTSWLNVSEVPLEAAAMVVNHKKRKRVDEDVF
jgi:GINS complex subunit 3